MKNTIKILTILLLSCKLLFANNITQNEITLEELINSYLDVDTVWFNSLKNYKEYEKLQSKYTKIEDNIENAKKLKDFKLVAKYQEELSVINNNLNLYEYKTKPPFFELFVPFENILKKLNEANITLVSIFSSKIDNDVKKAQRFMKLNENEYIESIKYIDDFVQKLEEQNLSSKAFEDFKSSIQNDKELMKISLDSLKMINEKVLKGQIKYHEDLLDFKNTELYKFLYIALTIFAIYIIFSFIKLIFRRKNKKDENSEEDEQKYFTIKKLLNVLFIVIALLIIAFSYVDNVTQALAIFGVVGAGLTIVMKEWVLSFIGWIVLMFTNSIKIGDRIRIDKDGKPIIGDVINISLTKLTLYENITNDSLNTHKRAGRIIFVPNHFLITNEVYNYTHYSLKTILDSIEINITFDSNLEKVEKLALEVANNITSRYMDMAKRQYHILKERYTIRNMPNYPRVFFYPHVNGDGVTIGLWYVTPYREILKLKSEVTKELINKLKKEDDIHLLYSASSMFVEKLPNK